MTGETLGRAIARFVVLPIVAAGGLALVQAPAADALSPVTDGVSGPAGLVARVERARRVSGALELTVSVANRGTKGVTAVGPLAYLLDGITTGATALDPQTGRVGAVRCSGGECESGRFPRPWLRVRPRRWCWCSTTPAARRSTSRSVPSSR